MGGKMSTPKPMPPTRSINAEIEIAALADAVWRALTDAAELVNWFPTAAGTNPDGTVWMAFGEDFRFSSRVEALEPGRYMKTVAVVPGVPEGTMPPMVTEITLETRGGKTLVRLVQSGFLADPSWDAEYDGTRTGWRFQLRALKHYLERHAGAPRELVWVRSLHGLPREEAWQRIAASLFGGKTPAEGPVRLALPGGEMLEGTVLVSDPPGDVTMLIENWNGALLRIQSDDLPLRGVRDTHFWMNTYGLAPGKADALRAQVGEWLATVFPEAKQ
jgi:uncharacterized protein YndB with AHSA1/START domain